MNTKKQSGNVLIFILIAIVLLGGLTVLLSRTGSQSEDTGDTEQLAIQASTLLEYAGGLQSAVQSLRMRGCSENQISFEISGVGQEAGYNNPNAPVDLACHVFYPNGAGITYKKKEDFFPKGVWTGNDTNNFVGRSSIIDVGTALPELYWIMRMPDDGKNICTQINRQLGYADPTPPVTAVFGIPPYNGTFSAVAPVVTPALTGKKTYCISYSSTPEWYYIYSVLIAR